MSRIIAMASACDQALPGDWSATDLHFFEHLRRCDGLSVAEARESIESQRHIERIVPGETEQERCLRMAREALASLRRRRGGGSRP